MPKAKNTTKAEKQEMAICPCCGKPTIKKPIKIDSKIVDDYMASIITGVPFSHTFEMFDGKLAITVGAVPRETSIILYRFGFLVEPFASTDTQVADLLGMVNAYCGIQKIVVESSKGNKIYMPGTHIIEACKRLVESWTGKDLTNAETKAAFIQDIQQSYLQLSANDVVSSTPPVVITRVINDFRALESIMLEAGFDENFWKGIELA